MTKKEIIKTLQQEVGFLDITEDENKLGELYITEAKFRELEDLIIALKFKKELFNKAEKKLIEQIKKGEGSYVDISQELLKDKTILCSGDIYFLQPKGLTMTNCVFMGYEGIEMGRLKKEA